MTCTPTVSPSGLPSALASPPFSPWHPASLFLGASTSSQARGLTIFSAALGRPASLSAAAPHAARGPLLARPPAAPLPPLAAGQSPLSPPAQQQVRTNFPTSFPMMPKNTKYRKAFRSMGFNNQIAPNTRQPRYGKYALRALGMGRVPANTIEVCRR